MRKVTNSRLEKDVLMIINCENKTFNFTIDAPPSKSIYHRELIIRFLCGDHSNLEILANDGEDVRATKIILQILHNTILENEMGTKPENVGRRRTLYIPCNESGSTLRFMIPVAAALLLGKGREHHGITELCFQTTGRLFDRPIKELADAMMPHNFNFAKHPETRSIILSGEMTPGEYVIDGSVSSQYISGLLMALTLFNEPCNIKVVGNITSAPYIQLTQDVLEKYGCTAKREGNVYYVKPGGYAAAASKGKLPDFAVEGDWSNGAFLLCLQRFSDIKVTNLNFNSEQGDRVITDFLKLADEVDNGTKPKSGVTWDITNSPDIAPYMAMVAPFVFDDITFTGINRLRIKESDRVAAIREQLAAVGVRTDEDEDTLTVYRYNPGEARNDSPIKLSSYNDHRMAMSAILLATILKTKIEIDDVMCIRKSYPEFLDYIASYFS